MKKQFVLSVIVTIGILFIVNGQNSKNFNNKFLENKKHQQKTELQKENHTPFSSNKIDIKDIQLHLKETNVYTKKLDSIVGYEYDDITAQLLPYSLYKYTYDANNNVTYEIDSYWDISTNSWIFDSKYEYTYDANNNLTSKIESHWDTSTTSWVFSSKYEYTYDDNNNLSYEIFSYWNTSTNSWINISKYEYTYDDNNNVISEIYSEWDTSTNSWIFDSKDEYTYDANNNLTSEIFSYWDTSTNSWIFDFKYEYTYDANNNIIYEITSYWDTSTNSWIFDSKYEFTYDLTVSIDNVLVPNNFDIESNNPILSYFYYYYDGSDFVLDMKYIFYYSDITGINEVTDNYNVSIYPNPATDYLIINTTINENLKIEIYTIKGQSVISTECTNNASQMRIDISQLPAGMYFIRIANNQNNITKKFVKE
ncbi:MAG: hypothetical protein PWQ14_1371 [Rikenellaceae bacterium]|nr:hypothetical protein [Rikenellaceae bacterium]